MWIKFLLAGAIIAFCVFIGYLAADKYRMRKRFFADFEAFNERFLSELAYARAPLPEFLRKQRYGGDFQKAVESLLRHEPPKPPAMLAQEEKEEFINYFSMLGAGDSGSQSGFFAAKKQYLSEKKAESAKEAKARGELYLKLGLLAGLAFVILII